MQSMPPLRPELRDHAEEGLRLCRQGDWNKGLPVLASVLENRWPGEEAPGIIYGYLGYGVARFQGKVRDGLRLCRHAVKEEFYEADNHYNLARVHMLDNDRKSAVASIERGLRLNPEHPGLLDFKREVGIRRNPVLGFLDRNHPLNVLLGRIRHGVSNARS